jgi:cytochrome c oxidase accessory protein FixG
MAQNNISPNISQEFRNHLGVLEEDGGRKWMYPRKANGKLYKMRTMVAIVLVAIFFALPFVRVDGHPFMLLNLLGRKFILFGVPFFPQDFYLLALSMLCLVVFVILFTAIFGRIFCGWVCPQTIFMEMIFRRIEYWIEGDAHQQKKLNQSDWNAEKIVKKTAKHFIFFMLSFVIANTFLAYLIGVEELQKMIVETPLQHAGSFTALVLFTAVFYSVFAHFRELACIVVCPYGRLQGVLLDNNSIVVSYDYVRGEPRGKLQKTTESSTLNAAKGDCIDCKLCVQVCPTGIDIRNGTQLECVNCTACIDACDDVMLKINKPTGLIRYDSMNGIKDGKKLRITPRIAGYAAVLILLIGLTSFFLLNRTPIQATILRTPGMLYQQVDEHTISNLYNGEFVNKTFEDVNFKLKIKDINGANIKIVGGQTEVLLKANQVTKATFFIEIPQKELKGNSNKITIEGYNGTEKVITTQTTFLAPQ